MICPNCGKNLYDNASQCSDCGTKFAVHFQDDGLEIKSYMFLAVLSAMLCLPFGLVSVYYAFKVESFLERDDIRRAMMYSRKAWNWSFWSLVVAGFAFLIYIVFFILTLLVGMLTVSTALAYQ